MPTYSYSCSNCGTKFEKFLKISERMIPTESPCPQCNSQSVTKTLDQVTIGDPFALGVRKIPQDFKEGVLNRAKKMPGSQIRD